MVGLKARFRGATAACASHANPGVLELPALEGQANRYLDALLMGFGPDSPPAEQNEQ